MDIASVATHWLMAGQAQTHTFVFKALLSQYYWPWGRKKGNKAQADGFGMEFSTGFAFSDLAARSISHWPLEACWIELCFPLQILNKVDDTVGITIYSPLGIAANMLLNLRAISPVITKQ